MRLPDIAVFDVADNRNGDSLRRRNDEPPVSTGNEPRSPARAAESGGMHCDLLRWAAAQVGLTPHLQGILVRLVRLMDEGGAIAMSLAEIAPRIGMRERQTRAAIASLVTAGALSRKRRGGSGVGRFSDILTADLAHMATGDVSPIAEQTAEEATCATGETSPEPIGEPSPVAGGDGPPNAAANGGSPPVSISPRACIENAGTRAETPINITLSESNSETPESSGERGAQAREMPEFAGDLDLDWSLGAKHRAFAGERGFLNGSCDEMFGQFLDHCATKGPQVSPRWGAEWRKFVRRGVEFAARHKASHESTNDRQPARTPRMEIRRGKVSATSAFLLGGQGGDDSAIDLGRLDSQRID